MAEGRFSDFDRLLRGSSRFFKIPLQISSSYSLEVPNDINMHKCNTCFSMFLGVFWTSKSLRPPQDFCSGFEAKVVQTDDLRTGIGLWGSSGFLGVFRWHEASTVVTRSCAPRSSENLVVGFDSLKGRFECV